MFYSFMYVMGWFRSCSILSVKWVESYKGVFCCTRLTKSIYLFKKLVYQYFFYLYVKYKWLFNESRQKLSGPTINPWPIPKCTLLTFMSPDLPFLLPFLTMNLRSSNASIVLCELVMWFLLVFGTSRSCL